MFLFGFSLCEVLELVMIFNTNSSLSKTDFVCKTYRVFHIGGLSICLLKRHLTSPLLVLSSLTLPWCFSTWSCRAHCGDSNETKIIKNGVRMIKIFSFPWLVFLQFSLGRSLRGKHTGVSGPGRKFPDWSLRTEYFELGQMGCVSLVPRTEYGRKFRPETPV